MITFIAQRDSYVGRIIYQLGMGRVLELSSVS